jgi:hypothetical protein
MKINGKTLSTNEISKILVHRYGTQAGGPRLFELMEDDGIILTGSDKQFKELSGRIVKNNDRIFKMFGLEKIGKKAGLTQISEEVVVKKG